MIIATFPEKKAFWGDAKVPNPLLNRLIRSTPYSREKP